MLSLGRLWKQAPLILLTTSQARMVSTILFSLKVTSQRRKWGQFIFKSPLQRLLTDFLYDSFSPFLRLR